MLTFKYKMKKVNKLPSNTHQHHTKHVYDDVNYYIATIQNLNILNKNLKN